MQTRIILGKLTKPKYPKLIYIYIYIFFFLRNIEMFIYIYIVKYIYMYIYIHFKIYTLLFKHQRNLKKSQRNVFPKALR